MHSSVIEHNMEFSRNNLCFVRDKVESDPHICKSLDFARKWCANGYGIESYNSACMKPLFIIGETSKSAKLCSANLGFCWFWHMRRWWNRYFTTEKFLVRRHLSVHCRKVCYQLAIAEVISLSHGHGKSVSTNYDKRKKRFIDVIKIHIGATLSCRPLIYVNYSV